MTQVVLRTVLLFELVLLALGLIAFAGHALWLWAVERKRRPQIALGRRLLSAAIDRPPTPDELAAMSRFPDPIQITIFEELAPSLTGSNRLRLIGVATAIGLVDTAEGLCRHRAWWRRLRGARILTLLGGGSAIMPDLLNDKVADVRAQAAEWAAWHPNIESVERLILLLDDDRSLARFTVQDSLLRLGTNSVEPLERALHERRVSNIATALDVAAGLLDSRFLRVALGYARDDNNEIRAAAARVLGSVGSREAIDQLQIMLDDDSPPVRVAAATAMGRIGHWPSAPRLGRLLGDLSWEVRRTAALSLARFGAPGLLILRRSLKAEDRFARDMARHVLDMQTPQGIAS